MLKLKSLLGEGFAWERKAGKPLPSLAEVQAEYQAKLRKEGTTMVNQDQWNKDKKPGTTPDNDLWKEEETPDEWETPAGQKEKEVQYNNPTYQAPENKAPAEAQEAVVPTGNIVIGKEIDKAPILARSDFPSSYSISKNFKIGQLVKPDYQWGDYMLPPSVGQRSASRVYTKQDMVANLAALAENVLEPIYTLLGPTSGIYAPQSSKGVWSINSGLRNATNGSDHNKGRAFDMQYSPKRSFKEMWQLAVDLEKILPYNQIILEYRKPGSKGNQGTAWQNWIHISYSTDGNAKMAFSMIDDSVVNSSGVVQAGAKGIFLFGTA